MGMEAFEEASRRWPGLEGSMLRKIVTSAALLAVVASLGGCFSLNWDENVSMINKWGKDAHDVRQLTNKYFFNYDANDPFDN
jgi:hypothetical protein